MLTHRIGESPLGLGGAVAGAVELFIDAVAVFVDAVAGDIQCSGIDPGVHVVTVLHLDRDTIARSRVAITVVVDAVDTVAVLVDAVAVGVVGSGVGRGVRRWCCGRDGTTGQKYLVTVVMRGGLPGPPTS